MSQSVVNQASNSNSNLNNLVLDTVEKQADLLNQLLQPEIQQALIAIIDNLPKLSIMATVLVKTYDTSQSLLTDNVLKKDTIEALKQFAEPIEDTVKNVAANAIEAKDRAEAHSSTSIGVFGLLRMLKDPQIQKVFRFVQAYVDIANEKQK